MRRLVAAASVTAAVASLGLITSLSPAEAFKPYTHNATAQPALADVTDDGNVTIKGREYPVDPRVVDALTSYPSYYQAGVIGPDGFPDLTYGQSTIHPVQTGKWLGYLLQKAWAAQTDPAYDTEERKQILAFAYGFLTHAAGDMWAHTFVNDFAEGIFPGVGEMIDEPTKAAIAVRHIIVEGYIGDATPGYDGNGDRGPVGDGDVSDDSTPGIDFAAPDRWIYDTLVDPNQPLPVGTCGDGVDDDHDGRVDDGCPGGTETLGDSEAVRGPLIDYFLDKQAELEAESAMLHDDEDTTDCLHADPDCYERTKHLTVQTVRGPVHKSYTYWNCEGATIGCVPDPVDLADDEIPTRISFEYLDAWIDDIKDGLRQWGTVGLASTRALFDPQTRRDLQNDECGSFGGENVQARIDCENKIGTVDVLMDQLEPFINDHLLSMMGLPDAVGGVLDILGVIGDFLDDLLGPALNPLRVAKAAIREQIKELVLEQVKEQFGLDIETIGSILRNPTHYMEAQSIDLPLGGGTVTLELFKPEEHARLDNLLHLPADHHVDATAVLPNGDTITSTALKDDATFHDLAIFDNAVTTAKLLLLDGPQLNKVGGNVLADAGVVKSAGSVTTYTDKASRPANIMVDALGGGTWLTLIDGDHSWRDNGAPRFDPTDQTHGGEGTFPLWESCLLRPAFRSLYDDWENGTQDFPDLGDDPASDPSDTAAPTTTLGVAGGPSYKAGDGTQYYAAGNTLTATGSDAVFADNGVTTQVRAYRNGTSPLPAWTQGNGSASVALTGTDGAWTLQGRSGDPCHAVDGVTATSNAVVLDTTGPTVSVSSPVAGTYDTDDTPSLTWTATDGGSGVKTETATLDGRPIAKNATIDMFFQDAGLHTVVVTAADQLGNTTTVTRVFRVRATAVSLLSNLDRAWSLKLLTSNGHYQGMRTSVQSAITAHNQGKHSTELNKLGAVLNQLRDAVAKKVVDPTWAARYDGYLVDLIAHHP